MKQDEMPDMEKLLIHYLNDDLAGEEWAQVEAWLQTSEENRRIAKQMQMLYLATDIAHVMGTIDAEKALKKVQRRMMKKRLPLWVWVQRAAAVLFIPLLMALLVQYLGYRDSFAEMLEVKTNPGMVATVILPDSTIACLNAESSLRYPVKFGKEREVFLNGEAYFEVAKDRSKKFIVTIPHSSQIEVLGTHFNVEAYGKEENISTTLVEGKICFLYEAAHHLVHKRTLSPGQKLVYNSQTKNIELYPSSGIVETSWKDGRIVLDDTPLKGALKMLEKRFNVSFVVVDDKLLDNSFTGLFVEQGLEQILEYFEISSKIRWRYLTGPDVRDMKRKIEIY